VTGPGPGRRSDATPTPMSTPTQPRLVLHSSDADQTRGLARAVAPLCVPGDVVLLVGDLGAGKTTFAQGFGAGLGVVEPVTSPTFTLVRQYAVPLLPPPLRSGEEPSSSIRTLLHADVYRLDHLHEIVDLGLAELVEDGAVALVEWGDVAEPVLGEGSLEVQLSAGPDDTERTITVSPHGHGWSERWHALGEVLAPWRVGG